MGVKERYQQNLANNQNPLYNGVRNRYIANNIDNITTTISERIKSWYQKSNDYFNQSSGRYTKRKGTYEDAYVSDSSDYLALANKQKKELEAEYEELKSFVSNWADAIGNDNVQSIYSSLEGVYTQLDKVTKAAEQDHAFWSQWKDASDYNTWAKAKKDYYNKYGYLAESEDFAENSKYKSTYRGGEKYNAFLNIYSDTGYDDIMYDYINRDENAISMQGLSDVSNNATLLGLDNSERKEMTDDEIALFNYIYATKGKDEAYDYVKYITGDLNARKRATEEAEWAEYAKENPIASSVFSVLTSPLKGVSYVGQVTDYLDDGVIDQNAGYNKFSHMNSAIRNEVSSIVEKKWGGVGSFAYQTGMSMGDFLFTTAITGGNSALSLGIMGTSAAADTVIASKDMGLSDDQAFWIGTAAGAIEVATEKIGIDALLDVKALKGSAGRYILKNLLAEGMEEGLSNVGNSMVEIIDLALSGDESKIKREISFIMQSQNVDESTAIGKYVSGKLKELGLDALGGAVSGGVMGGGGAVFNAVSNTVTGAQMKKAYGSDVGPALVGEALEINPTNKFAQNMQARVDSGKSLSNRQIGTLVQQNENSMRENDVAAIESATQKRLTQLGETANVEALAKAITKKTLGESLGVRERALINNSQVAQRVLNELDAENIKSGQYSSAWAEKIGTDRIGVEEYSRLINEANTEAENLPKAAPNAEVNKTALQANNVSETGKIDNVSEVKTSEVKAAEIKTPAENTATSDVEKVVPAGATDGETVQDVPDADVGSSIEEVAKGEDYKRSGATMVSAYVAGQDAYSFADEYDDVFNYAYSGTKSLDRIISGEKFSTLTKDQVKAAYDAGANAAKSKAQGRESEIKTLANGKTGRKKGVVKGEGVSINDLRTTFNDTQNVAYKVLSRIAEVTGVDIVLYKSETNESGNFVGAQGKYSRSDPGTIYIDINAGLKSVKDVGGLANYTMLRTFSHEFSHFIENFNPIWYNELRSAVFEQLSEYGEDVDALINTKMEQTGLDYDKASREVVAQALTDVLDDSKFVNNLAENHKNVFNKLLEKLKEFLADIKAYFSSISNNNSREANAMKKQIGEAMHYVESIVELFDKAAEGAVENYQQTVAVDEVVAEESKAAEEVAVAKTTTTTSENGYTITDDAENRTISIKFDGKPTLAVREALKNNAFVWNRTKGEWFRSGKWYDKNKASDVISALDKAYADNMQENAAENQSSAEKIDSVVTNSAQESASLNAKVEETKAEETSAKLSPEEVEQEYKKKFAPWFKKANNKYAFWLNGGVYLSDGSLAVKASEEILTFARLELPGQIYETALPEPASNAISTANKRIEVAPTEAKLDNKAVYAFDIDGKKKIFNKKLFSYIDGGLLYYANFNAKGGIIKSVTENGSLNGFLLSIVYNDKAVLTDEKPSKLKSFSKKMQELIAEKQAPKVKTEPTFTEIFENATQAEKDEVVEAINQNTKLSHMAPTEIRGETKEAIPNGETRNVDNNGSVQIAEPDRQGNSRLLDEVETEDVQRTERDGQAAVGTDEHEQQTERNDDRAGSGTGTRRGSSERDSQSRDLRVSDEPTEEAIKKAEKLHEEVKQQIEQKSTEKPKGHNFVIGDSLDLPNGEKAKCQANIEAIRLVKKLEAEGRYATQAEQTILSKYVGWGGLANAFDERKADWVKEFKELKEILSDEEYRAARASTTDAFYTDIPVIRAMYDGLAQLGFNGGRMLEPSSGIGNFVGAMPAEMGAKVKSFTMVELDNITGLIAKYLYPNADVRIQGFEKSNIPNNYMDVAIGNVPFGNTAIFDKAYPNKVTSSIHNYFFAKSLDKVRPGGIVMFITSTGTMSSRDSTVRGYIMKKADLLGAIRLPNTAFKSNAGTKVVADILILKKRADNTAYTGEEFLNVSYDYNNGEYINDYFANHPEMVLGVPTTTMGRNGRTVTYNPLVDKGSLGDQIREAFKHIEGKMDYPAQPSKEKTNFAVEKASKKTKENGYVVKDGKVYQNENGNLVEKQVAKGVAQRIEGILKIRDSAKKLLTYQQQGLKEDVIKTERANLNKLYDDFVKTNGLLNSSANRSAITDDPDSFFIFALENYNSKTKKATKADIFSVNTVSPNRTVTTAADVAEGLIVSRNETGGVDVALIAKLTNKSEADVTRELIDSRLAFKNRDGELEPAEIYLSGNVRAKLRDAQGLVPLDADYKNNVEALEAIIPKDVSYQEIFVNPGTPWIPNSVYSDFAAYMLGGRNSEYRNDVEIRRNETGNFTVQLNSSYLKYNASNTQKWGTPKRSFLDLFDAMLNSRSVVVKYKTEDGQTVVDKDATAAANEKIENIQKEFSEWLWKDEARRNELSKLYNEVFNSLVTPKYNGENFTVNGMRAGWDLKPHQKDAVQRVVSSGGNTLLAHKVGAGKTFEMAASAMKLKQLGLIKKPMFVVPKSLVAQWGKEFTDLFPAAKLLVTDAKEFTASNRKIYANKIANGTYDAVIVSYEQFEKLPMSEDYVKQFYQEQIDTIIDAINEQKAESGKNALSVKDLEKKKKSLEVKLQKLNSKPKDENNIEFEQLGVDGLFVDEAHNFKNLFYTTSMTNVAGLGNKDGSNRAFDLYGKVRYLQKLNGGRGIVFATATPVMNSMSEMYIMQKYLQPDLLKQLGLDTFDAWAKQFGEVVNGVEIKPSGQGYRVKQSFSRFKNLSELQLLFRNFADVLTDIPVLKIPKMKGGRVKVVECEAGEFQKDYMKELEKRADNVKNVDPSVDNMLKITSDGRKISYTQRMIDPSLPYEEGCKIYKCADNVFKEYNDSRSINGTQIVFMDMATPKGKSKADAEDTEMDTDNARLYEDFRARLVKLGIPASEIAFIHDADTGAKKKELFENVNEGKVRVLIGSTAKMGVGMNAQKRMVAIHHLDAPWRPGDVEQRDGRVFRQYNINDEVSKYTYVTVGSFDARLWDILDRKSGFINQIMNGDNVGRETEDTGEVTLSAAEVKALASGSPLILEQVQLDTDIKKLESLYRSHVQAIANAREKLAKDQSDIAMYEGKIEAGKEDIKNRTDTYSEGKFEITIGKKKYTDKKDAGIALVAEALGKATWTEYNTIGKFAGFNLRVIRTNEGVNGVLVGKQTYPFKTYPDSTTVGINHLISKVEGISTSVENWQEIIKDLRVDMSEQEALMNVPFAKQAELDQKRARYKEVMEILSPKEEQKLDSIDDDVQEQSREYLTSDHKAVMTQDRIDYLIEDSGAGSRKDYAQAWITSISPTDYLNLTTSERIQDRNVFDTFGSEWNENVNNTNYDYLGQLKKSIRQTPYLAIDINTGEVVGHDGRHRIRALEKEGIKSVEIKVEFRDEDGYIVKYSPNGERFETIKDLKLINQFGTKQSATIHNVIPLNEDHRSEIQSAYGEQTANENDIRYQERSDTLTDREVLELAAQELDTYEFTEGERTALDIFNKRLATLRELSEERAELGRTYKDQMFTTGGNRAEAAKNLERMKILDGKIEAESEKLLDVEQKSVLRDVLKKARKIVEQKERAHGQELFKRYRERRENAAAVKKYRDRIKADVTDLSNWILHPDNKNNLKHVPDALKNTVIPFLTSIDFTSKKQLSGKGETNADKAFEQRIKALRSAMKDNININGIYSGYNDLPDDFMDTLDRFIEATEKITGEGGTEYVVNKMSADELRDLSKLVKNLKSFITKINKFHANAMYQHVYEAGNDTIEALQELKPNTTANGVSNFLFWQQMRPAYAFERFGNGGLAIYDGLRRGQAKLAFNTKEIVDFAEATYTTKEVREWEDTDKVIKLPSGGFVRMKISQAMGFYELSKQTDSLRHMLEGGIRVATYKDGKSKISDVGRKLTKEDIDAIVETLTPRQRAVADELQKYMAKQGAEWGNYVSVARFGEELFTNPQYYPINSDGRHLDANLEEAPNGAALYALLNMSFTKSRNENANNRIVLYSIFDVFSNHMASMAQYNALALPVLDAVKWFNYKQVEVDENGTKTELGRVREEMDKAFGVPEETKPGSGARGYAQSFVINVIKAFNGTSAQGTQYDGTGLKALHKYNRAQIAYNLRVVMQQPLAITRAALLVDYASIIKGMKLAPSAIKANIEEMQKYSGIAAWKALGFYDVNISRGVTSLIKHDETTMDKVIDKGLWLAEKADTLTWSAIWSACKAEVQRKQKLKPTDEGYFEAVTKLFEDVIYKTQVVDSVLTKNEFMRDKGFFARASGSFMSEPVTTASMILDSYDKFRMDMQKGMSFKDAWSKNKGKIARLTVVYSTSAILLAAVQAVADAWRDDDEYEEWYEKYLDALGGNLVDELMPINKLPILSDFYDLGKSLLSVLGVDTYGNPPQSIYMQWYDSLIKGTEIIYDKIAGKDTNYTWYGGVYKLLQAASGMAGLPIAAATREVVTIWNNTIGAMAPSLKVKDYDAGPLASIKYAFKDGYLSEDEAMKLLLEQGLAEDENEAYYLIQEWSDKDGKYSKYDDLENALLSGEGFEDAMNDLIAHGMTEKEVRSEAARLIGIMVKEEGMSEERAVELLVQYTELKEANAREKVAYWAFRRDNPKAYEELTEASYTKYMKECEPHGVTLDTFYAAYMYRKEINADEDLTAKQKERKIRDYIYKMDISASHKRKLISYWY